LKLQITFSLQRPPFLKKVDNPIPDGGNANYEGYTKDLMDALAEKMGLKDRTLDFPVFKTE
jgi:hypothetical protein